MKTISDVFGSLVFNDTVMQARLPKATYRALQETIQKGSRLDPEVANIVANAMKDWAVEKGRHPFHPLVPAHDGRHGGKA